MDDLYGIYPHYPSITIDIIHQLAYFCPNVVDSCTGTGPAVQMLGIATW
jgi:hypothetical protein